MNNMQKAFKRKAQGLADGGVRRPDPSMLGTGLARGAGGALQGRAARLAGLEAEAMGEAPARPAPPPVTGGGGLSRIRDGAVPPAHMLAAQRRGMADGGRATPELLGWGLARGAGRLLAGRGARLETSEAEAMGEAPAPAAPVVPAGAGGMSRIRDGAVPPAHMLAAQRRGLRDGGTPEPTTSRQQEMLTKITRLNTPPHLTRYATGTPFGLGAYEEIVRERRPDLRTTAQGVADQRAAAGLPSGAEIRAKLGLPAVRPDPRMRPPSPAAARSYASVPAPGAPAATSAVDAHNLRAAQLRGMLGLADGGKRGNAGEIEVGNGGAVRGPGGPTDDAVGPVALSNKEYVLPADTVDAMGGAETLDQIRDATHEFVDEGNRPGMANGGEYERVGPADPGWFARQQNMARAERAAAAAVKTGTASHAQQTLYEQNQAAIDDPAVMNPLSEIPGVGLIGREAAAASPGVISGLRAGVGKATDFLAAKLGAAGGGAVAKPVASSAAKMLTPGAMPTASRVGANALATGGTDAAMDAWLGEGGAPRAATPGARPAPAGGAAAPGNAEDARVAQALAGIGVSGADQGSDRVTYAQAQGLSRARPQAGKNYRLGGGQYSDSNADIFAGSTRADGTLNSFAGVGNGNRPNWEQRNPQDHQAALERAANDKASVTEIAANYAAQGDNDNAYRMAAGDPAATAAVEAAFQQRGLRQAALRGNKEAGAILRQQAAGAASRDVANISAGATERVGLAKARADMAKAQQDQANWNKTHNLAVRTADRADGKSRRGFLMQSLEGKLGKQFDNDGNLSPAFAGFEASLRNTLQGRTTPDGQPLTVDNLSEQQMEQLAQRYALNAKAQPGWFGSLWDTVTGNDFPETSDLELTAPRAGTAQKRLLGGYSYKDQRGKERRVDDLSWEELAALGVPVRGQ